MVETRILILHSVLIAFYSLHFYTYWILISKCPLVLKCSVHIDKLQKYWIQMHGSYSGIFARVITPPHVFISRLFLTTTRRMISALDITADKFSLNIYHTNRDFCDRYNLLFWILTCVFICSLLWHSWLGDNVKFTLIWNFKFCFIPEHFINSVITFNIFPKITPQ